MIKDAECPYCVADSATRFKYMSFDDALKALFLGEKVRRKGWNSKNTFISVHIPVNDIHLNAPFLLIDTTNAETNNPSYRKGRGPYTPSQCDIFASDWVIFRN